MQLLTRLSDFVEVRVATTVYVVTDAVLGSEMLHFLSIKVDGS
jgi:hypothetical protein